MISFIQPFIRLFASLMRVIAVIAVLTGTSATASLALLGASSTEASAATVRSISVRGNQRVDAETIRSYLTIKPGRRFSSYDTDESLRQLFATGLFSDVRIVQRGSTLVVQVEENPTINLVIFEGNEKVKSKQLASIVQSKSLGIFSQDKLTSDLERVREAVRRSGRASSNVNARVDQLENNRVNVVFEISEGERTKIAEINFVGNNAFGDSRLSEVVTHNESNFLSWLKRDDLFDPDRLRADEERLRRFYFNRGYADFRVISAVGEYDADANAHTITITVDEGERYSFGTIDIDNALSTVDTALLQDALTISTGDTYSARKVERSLVAMTEAIATSGYAFAEVTPRGDRDFDNRTINLTFFVDEGPRNYIERIEIIGNNRTRDYVIRREFDISEGDAYNRVLINKAKRRLDALGFFENVRISTRQGSAADRVIVVINITDKSTGEFSIGGGYSSSDGALGEISVTERNFLGRGQYLKVSGSFGEETTKYELSFTEPYFLGHRLAVGFDLSQSTTESNGTQKFDHGTFLARLRASAPITNNLRASVNYTFKSEELTVTPALLPTLSPATADTVSRSPFTTSSLGYALTYSSIDNLQKPREGIYGTFRQDFAGLGGDAQYVRTTGRLTGYYLLSEDADIVLKGTFGAGHIVGYGSDTVRITDHFVQGGETIRGFDTRGYGPRDSITDESLGGLTYANVSAEVQFPVPVFPRSFGLRAALFADAGTLFGNDFVSATTQDDATIRASVGASLIWDSPFGPLRADFSHVLTKESYDKTEFFRFGVSTKF
ncbi:MAG: outer membrane protein assembly factor BamA [Rhizobiaceae bacterium]